MRSGIGPAPHLAECGIEVLLDLPGVGQNLMEHPSAGLVPFLKPAARQRGADATTSLSDTVFPLESKAARPATCT